MENLNQTSKKRISVLISTLFILLSSIWAQTADTTVKVTFIGSAGYILESPTKKIMIDGAFDEIVTNFGSAYPSEEIWTKLTNGEAPFDCIDLFLFTHIHKGHMDPVRTAACFENNPDAEMITTQQVYDELQATSASFSSYSSRIHVPEIDFYTSTSMTTKGVPLNISRTDHWGDTELIMFSFNLDGMEIAFYIGYEPNNGEHYIKTLGIDLGIIDVSFIMEKQEMLKDFEFGFISLTHLSYFEEKEQSWIDKINELSADNTFNYPEINYLSEAMEQASFTKKDGIIYAETNQSSGTWKNHIDHNNIKVFPNPAKGIINIELLYEPQNAQQISIINLAGETICSEFINGQKEFSIDLTDTPKGLYFLNFSDDQNIYCKKVILN